jgi:uncharacterized protein YdeI (YjbR/CyaY-like superfamily)
MEPRFFATPDELRAWFEANHASEPELLVGFHKKASGMPSITWPESVEQALCFGWIDGIRRSYGETSYTIRFTPRRRGSTWSAVNIRLVERLIAEGLMLEPGIRAFEARKSENSAVYSFEQGDVALSPEDEALIAANPDAWEQWQKFPPSYRKLATWWVISAKRPDTRSRRLQQLIEGSASGERVGPWRRPERS